MLLTKYIDHCRPKFKVVWELEMFQVFQDFLAVYFSMLVIFPKGRRGLASEIYI